MYSQFGFTSPDYLESNDRQGPSCRPLPGPSYVERVILVLEYFFFPEKKIKIKLKFQNLKTTQISIPILPFSSFQSFPQILWLLPIITR
jgi:hypothetical protein